MGYAYDESPFVPFNTPQVGPTIPAMPTTDIRDAEIANLRLELKLAKNAAGYEPHEHADESVTGFAWRIASLWKAINDAQSALAAARAAHAKDRAVCDRWRSACPKVVSASDGWSSPSWMMAVQALKLEALAHDARRAAEAKGEPK